MPEDKNLWIEDVAVITIRKREMIKIQRRNNRVGGYPRDNHLEIIGIHPEYSILIREGGYSDNRWGMTIGRDSIKISLGQPKEGKQKCMYLWFGHARRDWYNHFYYCGEYKYMLTPCGGSWHVTIGEKSFRYWQFIAIIREIRKAVRDYN